MLHLLKKLPVLAVLVLASMQMTGCATMTSLAQTAAQSVNPTVMASLDSFETAAMAIKLSNRVLQDIPISESDEWPSKLSASVGGMDAAKMGLSLVGSAYGVTIATEMDKETGFPRPTSALYLFLKDREKALDALPNKKDIAWFKKQPRNVISRERTNKPAGTIDPNMYRNALMAYGVVTANELEIIEMQQAVDDTAKGFKACNAFIHSTTSEVTDNRVIKASCPDPALKDEQVQKTLTTKVSELEADRLQAEKAHGRLATRVHKTAVAGADFTASAIIQVTSALINGARALPNIHKEFQGLKGAYNVAVLVPRAKNVVKSLSVYKNQLGFQVTVYKTMYQQVKGTYKLDDDADTKQAKLRINAAEVAMAELEPKLTQALAGAPVEFTDHDLARLSTVAAMFPSNRELEQTLLASLVQ